MDLIDVVRSRRSIRKFKPEKISREVICSLLGLARWSPSAHNTQPWRLVVVDDAEVKANLAKEMGEIWVSDLTRDGVERIKAEETVRSKNWSRITNSPVVVMVCLDKKAMHKYGDARRRRVEYLTAVQSVAAYVQTFLLLAHNYGFGTCWACTPLFCQDRVRKVLKLPQNLEPQVMIIMGFPDEKPSPSSRKPMEGICAFNSWSTRAIGANSPLASSS
jgi:coenzyme F420-0:L-glutamate ligase/coenzyme F420-1:gamma-L-glutamate ligase